MSRVFARFCRLIPAFCAVWLFAGVCSAAPENAGQDFESANKLYEEGKFTDAAAAYGKLALSGRTSAALYFNLGNAFFKSGQIGRAVTAYRQAAQITPRDPDIRANLQFARKQVAGPTVEATRWQQWLGRLSLNEWTGLTAATVWILFLLLAARQWWPDARPTLRNYAILIAIAAISLGACLAAQLYETRLSRTAIVIAHDAVVRLGPVTESQEAFTVHDGAELRVLDQKDDWIAVSAGPGRFGWVRRDQVLLSSPG